VDTFQYLESYTLRTGDVDVDSFQQRKSFNCIPTTIYAMSGDAAIAAEHKAMPRPYVLPTVIYAGETWTSGPRPGTCWMCSYMRRLRNILGISWKDHVTNDDLLQKATLENLHYSTVDRRVSCLDEDDTMATSYVCTTSKTR